MEVVYFKGFEFLWVTGKRTIWVFVGGYRFGSGIFGCTGICLMLRGW